MKLPVIWAVIGGNRPVNEREHLKDIDIVGRIILKWALRK
jgi:hypothetical protein